MTEEARPVVEADEAFLGQLLGEFVDALADGKSLDLTAPLRERPDLADRIRETVELSYEAAMCRPPQRPQLHDHEILAEIGHGGMGTVYLARHLRLGRRVALKTISQSFASSQLRERFAREARAVARLRHPNICQVYDVGEAEGVPYFTMELIDGRSLSRVLDALRATGRRPEDLRLEDWSRAVHEPAPASDRIVTSYVEAVCRLVVQVAHALAHAHAQEVVHRDVKPSNILLRPGGEAVLCDFGLARVAGEHSLTGRGEMVGTPQYMAPEQIEPGRGAVDGRTDVYALGATLYECLSLRAPFAAATTQALLAEVLGHDPTPLSRLNPAVPRDLQTICATALEKSPDRRYASAEALADDLERFLELRPILARPIGTPTRVLRFAQRNRTLSASLAAAGLLAVLLPTALWWQERAAFRRVLAEKKHNEGMVDYLTGWLGAAAPAKGGREARLVDMLDTAVLELEAKFAGEPVTKAGLLSTLATTYQGLGLYKEAARLFAAAHQIYTGTLGERSRETIGALEGHGLTLVKDGKVAEGEAQLAAALAVAQKELGPRDALTLSILHEQAVALQERRDLKGATALLRNVLERRAETLGAENPDTLNTMATLASVLSRLGEREEPERLHERVVAGVSSAWGPDHPDTLTATNNRAIFLWRVVDKPAEAEAMLRDVLTRRRSKLGASHALTLASECALAEVLHGDRPQEALDGLDAVIERLRREQQLNRDLQRLRYYRAKALFKLEKYEEVVAELETVELNPGGQKDDLTSLSPLYYRALSLQKLTPPNLDEAEKVLVQIVERSQSIDPDLSDKWKFLRALGSCRLDQARAAQKAQAVRVAADRREAAEEPLVKSYQNLSRVSGEADKFTKVARKLVYMLYSEWPGKEHLAEAYR